MRSLAIRPLSVLAFVACAPIELPPEDLQLTDDVGREAPGEAETKSSGQTGVGDVLEVEAEAGTAPVPGTGGRWDGGSPLDAASDAPVDAARDARPPIDAGPMGCCFDADTCFVCPTKAALDRCLGFDLGACLAKCSVFDAACASECAVKAAASPPNPSGCAPL